MSLADYLIHLPAKFDELPQSYQELESCLPENILPPELLIKIWRYVKWENVSKKLKIWLSRHSFKNESASITGNWFPIDGEIMACYWRSPKARKTLIIDTQRGGFVTLVSKYTKYLGLSTNVLSCEYTAFQSNTSFYPNMYYSSDLDLLEPETIMFLVVMSILE